MSLRQRASPPGSKVQPQAHSYVPGVCIRSPQTCTDSPWQDKDPFPGDRKWVPDRLPVGLGLRRAATPPAYAGNPAWAGLF